MRVFKWAGLGAGVLLLLGMTTIWTRVSLWRTPTPSEPPVVAEEGKDRHRVITEGPAPRITVSINCLGNSVAREGTPLLIEATISPDYADNRTIPFVLSKSDGAWGDFVSIEFRDAKGQIVPRLDLRSAYQTRSSISIAAELSGKLVWIAQPAAGKLLTPGEYTVVAVLDSSSSSDANSWRGTTRSSTSKLTVKPAAVLLSGAEARLAAVVEMRIHDSLKQGAAALAAADRYLAEHPKDRTILEEKGDVLASLARFGEALAAYDAALDSIPPPARSGEGEAPEGLLIKRARAERELRKVDQK